MDGIHYGSPANDHLSIRERLYFIKFASSKSIGKTARVGNPSGIFQDEFLLGNGHQPPRLNHGDGTDEVIFTDDPRPILGAFREHGSQLLRFSNSQLV